SPIRGCCSLLQVLLQPVFTLPFLKTYLELVRGLEREIEASLTAPHTSRISALCDFVCQVIAKARARGKESVTPRLAFLFLWRSRSSSRRDITKNCFVIDLTPLGSIKRRYKTRSDYGRKESWQQKQ